jgi:hypothetical protein
MRTKNLQKSCALAALASSAFGLAWAFSGTPAIWAALLPTVFMAGRALAAELARDGNQQ